MQFRLYQMQSKSVNWFLYDTDPLHEKVCETTWWFSKLKIRLYSRRDFEHRFSSSQGLSHLLNLLKIQLKCSWKDNRATPLHKKWSFPLRISSFFVQCPFWFSTFMKYFCLMQFVYETLEVMRLGSLRGQITGLCFRFLIAVLSWQKKDGII